MRLNHVTCFRRIKSWLSRHFTEDSILLEYDEQSCDLPSLHFVAVTEDGHAPIASKAARKALEQELGPAFSLVVSATQMSIYVMQPTESDAVRLKETFKWRSLAVMRRVWPISFAGAVVLLSFASLCYFASHLHMHWKDWDSPYENMFHSMFGLAIWCGDRFTGAVWHAREL